MTPSDKLAYLETLLARHPQARLHSAFDKLRIHEKAEELNRASDARRRQQTIIDELRALGRKILVRA